MDQSTSELLIEIREFIVNERWDYGFTIELETSLQNDLKLFGDDASEFLMNFCKKYQIDYSDFNFDDYFRPESSWTDAFNTEKEYENFTVQNLLDSINSKKLL